ncbi:MAG: hypothetical protein AB7V18_19150 [Pyrinomonadaceae bacterium]
MPVSRFEAEAILRAAASGAIPQVGDTLIRVQNGWVFAQGGGAGSDEPLGPEDITSLPFSKITGVASRGQLPAEIAYEDEQNFFSQLNQFSGQVRRGMRTVTIVDSPVFWFPSDWHMNVNTDLGPVTVQVPDATAHGIIGFTNQIHIKHVGRTSLPVYLTPIVSGQKIDGSLSAVIREPNRCFSLISDSANWWIQ